MEQEMKYALPSKEVADSIWDDELILETEDVSTEESLVMKAVYFDTEDRTLSRNNMTVRVRVEGEHCFATLKWGGSVTNGYHEHNEVNVPVDEDLSFISPSAAMFKDSEDGRVLLDLIGDEPLTNLLETRFLRRKLKLNYKGSLIELALDQGSIITDAGELPLLEMELELYAGSTDSIKELGDILARKYDLSPENRSKFARGYAMIKG